MRRRGYTPKKKFSYYNRLEEYNRKKQAILATTADPAEAERKIRELANKLYI
jgi:ERCC4-related helicase